MGAGCGRCRVGAELGKGMMMVEKTLRAAISQVCPQLRDGIE